jgi:hypothetical protein
LRKVKFEGWIIFDENECQHGTNMVGQVDHELFNVEGVVEWLINEISNEEIEYESEDE